MAAGLSQGGRCRLAPPGRGTSLARAAANKRRLSLAWQARHVPHLSSTRGQPRNGQPRHPVGAQFSKFPSCEN